MNFNVSDIVQRRERDGTKTVWIAQRFLTEEMGISEKKLRTRYRYEYSQTVSPKKRKKAILPDTGHSWRFAQMDGRFYYDYDRLPPNRKKKLPGREKLLEAYKTSLAESRREDLKGEVRDILKTGYIAFLHHYRGIADGKAVKLAKAASVVSFAAEHVAATHYDVRKSFFWQELAAVVDEVSEGYLPRNWRRLKEKVAAVLDGTPAEQVIGLPRAGNQNASKHGGDAEITSWILQLRKMPQNYPGAFIVRKVRYMCTLAGKKGPSKSWIEHYLASDHVKFLTQERYGSGKKRDVYKGYVPIENALHAGDCWMMDGTRVNFIGHRGKDGKEQFLYIVVVYDVHSGDILGVHYDTKEDRWAYINALKMACNLTGYLPWELVVDRFPGHNTDEMELMFSRFKHLGVKVTISSKKTAKAKVERLFNTLQTCFMVESAWYYGEGVQSSRSFAHRTAEYLKGQGKKRGVSWTFDAAWREMEQVFELYRNTPLADYSTRFAKIGETPRQLHGKSEKPHVTRVEPWDFIQLFGLEKKVSVRHNGLIKTRIQSVDYFYQLLDYNIISKHREVRICYDMEDLSEIYVFENSLESNREFLCTANERTAAKRYGPDADHAGIARAKEADKRLDRQRREELARLAEGGEEVTVLLGAHIKKENTSAAESRWLNERMGEWKDTKGKPRILPLEPVVVDTDDEDDDTVEDIRGNY